MCGEKNGICRAKVPHLGSPPRMRGKEETVPEFYGLRGITPACAGKRNTLTALESTSGDHPRVCGEKIRFLFHLLQEMGSPPRMRGKALVLAAEKVKFGITPACAGKSRHQFLTANRLWDHPRVCGEKGFVNHDWKGLEGSPPRMRGKEGGADPGRTEPGITPAYAGKSSRQPGAGRWRRDHPRVCGEKLY